MERTTIAAESRAVTDLFTALQEMIPDKGDSAKLVSTEIKDQFGRFNTFAKNLGTFADGHASLDYRLRNGEDAQVVTRQLLKSLSWFLQRGTTLSIGATFIKLI